MTTDSWPEAEAERLFEKGCAYFFGTDSVRKDPEKAVPLFQKAAAAGVTKAAHNLAICYYEGIGTKKSRAAAAHWFNAAALQGLPESQRMYGLMLYEGDGVAQGRRQGLAWLNTAAEGDCPAALVDLGYIYANEKNDEYDAETGARYFIRGAECGDRLAHTGLADLYTRLAKEKKEGAAHLMIDLYYHDVYDRDYSNRKMPVFTQKRMLQSLS